MPSSEPTPTAILMALAGVLMGASVLLSRVSRRLGVPVTLLFLAVGVLAGWEGLGGIRFDDYPLAFRIGTVALTLILFDGGLNTSKASFRTGFKAGALLATVGVALTAGVVALGSWLLGLRWQGALLLGAVVSSTDAASVFAMLRGSNLHLQKRVGSTLELESGFNDPMAVILTFSVTAMLVSGRPLGLGIALDVLIQLVVGAALGLGIGFASRWMLHRVSLPAVGLYPVLTLAVACLAFGLPSLVDGSGFLSVYVAGIIIGNGELPYRSGLLRVHDAVAWFSQVVMFLILGLLVSPPELVGVAGAAIGIALCLIFVARPAVTALLLWPFGYSWREIVYVGWVGLRGAVPIVLATVPVLYGAPGSEQMFNVIFFVVLVNAILQGSTVAWLTRTLGLESPEPPAPPTVLEIQSRQKLSGALVSYYIEAASAVSGSEIHDLPFPEGAAVMLVVRGDDLIAARGRTQLLPGDHVYVFCRREDLPFVQLMFGQPEES